MQNSSVSFFYLIGLLLISSVLLIGEFTLMRGIPYWVAPIGNRTTKNLVYLILILVGYISFSVTSLFLIVSISLITKIHYYWILVLLVVFLAYYIKSYYSFTKPTSLMLTGNYSKSLQLFKKNLKRNILIKTSKLYKDCTLYNMALNYHLMGGFEESTEWLLRIDKANLTNTLKSSVYSLEAGNLLMLGKNIHTAESYLEIALSFIGLPWIYLWYCYLYLLKNNSDEAKGMIEKYLHTQNNNQKFYGDNPRLIIDQKSLDAFASLVIGLYYQAMNDAPQAKDYFYKASLCPYDNIHKLKAVAKLEKMA